MYKIQANASGTRSIEVSDAHLEAIRKYALFKDLIDSSGFVDGLALEKLKLNARSILESQSGDKSLLDLCLDVIYNSYMKVSDCANCTPSTKSGSSRTLRQSEPLRLIPCSHLHTTRTIMKEYQLTDWLPTTKKRWNCGRGTDLT